MKKFDFPPAAILPHGSYLINLGSPPTLLLTPSPYQHYRKSCCSHFLSQAVRTRRCWRRHERASWTNSTGATNWVFLHTTCIQVKFHSHFALCASSEVDSFIRALSAFSTVSRTLSLPLYMSFLPALRFEQRRDFCRRVLQNHCRINQFGPSGSLPIPRRLYQSHYLYYFHHAAGVHFARSYCSKESAGSDRGPGEHGRRRIYNRTIVRGTEENLRPGRHRFHRQQTRCLH